MVLLHSQPPVVAFAIPDPAVCSHITIVFLATDPQIAAHGFPLRAWLPWVQ
jgi:hypothetical protein